MKNPDLFLSASEKRKKRKGLQFLPSENPRCQMGQRPENSKGYFEEMTKVVFRSGMNWKVIDNKWTGFQKAFGKFSIQKVSRYNDSDIERLIRDSAIVRNHKKILATIKNAREFLLIIKEYKSFKNYLEKTGREGEKNLCRELSRRFSFLGGSTTLFFLRAVGEEMPETMKTFKS